MTEDPSEIRARVQAALDREGRRDTRRLYLRLTMWVLVLAAIIAIVGTARSWW